MIPTRCSLIFGDQVGIVHHRITTFFVILNNFGLFPKDLHQVGTMISSVHASQWNIATLRAVALLKAVLWRDACRENTLEVVEIGATRSVASVPAVYQFLSVEQKSKVIFVPRSFLVFFTMKVRNSCLYLMKRGDRVWKKNILLLLVQMSMETYN